MPDEEPVTLWLQQLKSVDETAAENLWNHFCQRLRSMARRRLPASVRRVYDEDDAAASAFFSLCRGLQDGRFSELTDRTDLWRLLVVITARKAAERLRSDNRQKRGGGQHVVSIFADSSGISGVRDVPSQEPTPEFAAEVAETCDLLFEQLPEQLMQDIAMRKMEGYSNPEIADQLDVSRRTVERKLNLIRNIWSQTDEGPTADTAAD